MRIPLESLVHFQGVEIHPPKVGNSGEVLIPDP